MLEVEPPRLADRLDEAEEENGVRTDAIMTTVDSSHLSWPSAIITAL